MATLTLSIDDRLFQRASTVAASRGMSLDAYLSRLIHVVTQPPPMENELGPITRSLIGILPAMNDEDVARAIFDQMNEKFGDGLDLAVTPKHPANPADADTR